MEGTFFYLTVDIVLENALLKGYALNSLLAVEGHLIIWFNLLLIHRRLYLGHNFNRKSSDREILRK